MFSVPCVLINLLDQVLAGGIIVATDPESDEASASAGILVDCISPEVRKPQ